MNQPRLDLFELADRRLAWLDRRQGVLAQNIANVSTPGYVPRDLSPFAASLTQATGPAMARTSSGHLAGTQDNLLNTLQTPPTARSADGNAVSLDQQLTKVADSETTQELVTNIYKKYLGMFSMALGRGTG